MKTAKSDTQLNEKDAILDMLESEKQLTSFYAIALCEGNAKSVRKEFAANLNSVAENQYCLYNQMSSRGYYTPAPAQKQMIDQINETFKKQQKQLAN